MLADFLGAHRRELFDRWRDAGGPGASALVDELAAALTAVQGTRQDDPAIHDRALDTVIATSLAFVQRYERTVALRAHNEVAFVAHELRNPLSSALLALGMLHKQSGNAAGQTQALAFLERSLTRLRGLIEQALVGVRLRALDGSRALKTERIWLPQLLEDAVQECRLEADEKGIALVIARAVPCTLEADARLLRSAISNLLRNAVKFTHPGGRITLRSALEGGRAVVEVEDGCGGLNETRPEDLFLPFVQAGQDRTGFGLGLAIAREAVEAHGGRIGVRNRPPIGCVFVMEVPERPPFAGCLPTPGAAR